MTYKGTIDEDKQIVISRPLNEMDKKLIRVAYLNPEMRVATLRIVADDATNKLKQFVGDKKWKNPETNNLIGFDRVIELASKDKMWAKAILKGVSENYKKQEASKGESGGDSDTGVQNKIVKKLKGDVENEIKKFKGSGKDITNPKDRAEFEAYLDEKLGPAQEEAYRAKVREATGLVDEEFKKASEGLMGKGMRKALSKTFEDLGLQKFSDLVKPREIPKELGEKATIVGAGILGQLGSALIPTAGVASQGALATIGSWLASGASAVLLSPFMFAAGAALSYKVYKNYKETPEGAERAKIKATFNKKKEELVKKLEREKKYEDIGIEKSTIDGLKEFFKEDKFDDEILGDDLTIKEVLELSENGDVEEKQRAKVILEEKKKDYLAAKYSRQKFLIQETKGKKFQTPDGKRISVKEMLDLEEKGDSWAIDKLKDLRHTIEGPEEEEKEEDNESSSMLISNNDVDRYRNMSVQNLDQEMANSSFEEIERMERQLADLSEPEPKPTRTPKTTKKKRRTRKNIDTGITSEDAKVVLEAMGKIRKDQENMENKYKNETFTNPDGKSIAFNTLKKYFGDKDHKHHDWAEGEWKKLKQSMKKMGAEKKDQDKEMDKIVKEKFESALTIDPSVIELFKAISTDGKFDQKKLDEVMKGISELSKEFNSGEKKKASMDRASLIKLAYHNPDMRSEILKLLIK
jgi:hypothetical protein